jgi:predicted lipase
MNKAESLLCAIIAQSAYTNQCNEKDFQITAKFENKGTNTQGLFGVAYGNAFVVAFRGSEDTGPADWITDLKFLQDAFPFAKGYSNLKVHLGFLEAYKSVRDAVLKGVKATPHKRIFCIGHSLGGALATLSALDIIFNVPGKELHLYTYGSPKVGNAEFADVFNKLLPNSFRFVNSADIVPSVPVGDFAHIGKLFQLGQVAAESDSWSWDDIVNKVVGQVEDHLPYNYINRLRE